MHPLHAGSCQGRPTCLVACPSPAAVITAEVLAEEHEIFPVGVIDITLLVTMCRPPSLRIAQKQLDQPACDLLFYLLNRKHTATSGGTLNLEIDTIYSVIELQCV